MNSFDVYLLIVIELLVLIVSIYLYFYFKKNESKKDYYIRNGLKIPKGVKYFNLTSENHYSNELLNSFNEFEKNDLVLNVLKRFSGYHLYDYYDEIDLIDKSNNREILFTNIMVDYFGLEKVKSMKKENISFDFKWYEVVNDVRESSKGYKQDWTTLRILFKDDILENLRYIELLKKNNPELFVKN